MDLAAPFSKIYQDTGGFRRPFLALGKKSKCISSVFRRARRVLESELRCHVRKFIVEVPHTRAIRHTSLEEGGNENSLAPAFRASPVVFSRRGSLPLSVSTPSIGRGWTRAGFFRLPAWIASCVSSYTGCRSKFEKKLLRNFITG